ncbi:MAG: DUF2813 domain-containing protein [Flavobacteriales bacterium]|nr:MAG: DUF2813 domain-containing protein [Flavobacteriales bacterium]
MNFTILNRWGNQPEGSKSEVFLVWDDWNDYSFYTLFGIYYVDENSNKHDLGGVKIAFKGQKEYDRVFSEGYSFNYVGDQYFSLGTSEEYYENLNKLPDIVKLSILDNLNDIAKDLDLFNVVKSELVVLNSFLRSISETTVSGQYRRIALGGVKLTSYKFDFVQPLRIGASFSISFEVDPESLPPSNIHVLIGRNGVGKTFMIRNMVDTLLFDKDTELFGRFDFKDDLDYSGAAIQFANLIAVSYSVFDPRYLGPSKSSPEPKIKYSYIGIKEQPFSDDSSVQLKDPKKFAEEFISSLYIIKSRKLVERWIEAIETLQSDTNFRDNSIVEMIKKEDNEASKMEIAKTFERLSSGHKLVLLTITNLIEKLQERSLVILDEPEAHLHPPLLSAFIRALSDQLAKSNGVAIVATHSPVILQEVPKKCVWKLRRSGSEMIANRLDGETFGENVGTLTNDVFGLEVTQSGFYNLLKKEVLANNYNYNQVVSAFGNQLGLEARAIIMAFISNLR